MGVVSNNHGGPEKYPLSQISNSPRDKDRLPELKARRLVLPEMLPNQQRVVDQRQEDRQQIRIHRRRRSGPDMDKLGLRLSVPQLADVSISYPLLPRSPCTFLSPLIHHMLPSVRKAGSLTRVSTGIQCDLAYSDHVCNSFSQRLSMPASAVFSLYTSTSP